MWYPWSFGGLLEWTDATRSSIRTTDRYDSARKACNQIQQIAPKLESLEFVKTYASRAFEHYYPNSTYPATTLDVLATNTRWYDQDYRAVDHIKSWAPDTTREDGWAASEESDPYVQVSRFRHPSVPLEDPSIENYWFLIVNRRALSNERRKIELIIQTDSTYENYPYYVHYELGDSTIVTTGLPDRSQTRLDYRLIDVILNPGDAELVHFYRGGLGCDDNRVYIPDLTAIREGEYSVRLRWSAPDTTEDGLPFTPYAYRILGLEQFNGDFAILDSTTDTTYVDPYITPGPPSYYMVQACGEIHARAEAKQSYRPKARHAQTKILPVKVVTKRR
jgi:hypothetical protein